MSSSMEDRLTLEVHQPERRQWKWRMVTMMITSIGIAIIWGLLSVPSMVYFLPLYADNFILPLHNKNETGCLPYTKSVCLQALNQSKACFSGVQQHSINVAIPSYVDQVENGMTATSLIQDLDFLGASEACRSSFIPFMCLQLFPLCDEIGTAHKPSRNQCIEISTVVCKEVWNKALAFSSILKRLPDCESLNETADSVCKGLYRSVAITQTNSTCKDTFIPSNGTCVPQCGRWKKITAEMAEAVVVIVVISTIAGLGFGILVMILSYIGRKRMLVFPNIIIVYMNVSLVPEVSIILTSFTDRTYFFCSSDDLLKAFDTPTPFCSLAGSVYYYTILHLSILWLSHVFILFWKIKFPFHARHCEKKRTTHVLVVLLAVFIPTIPVIMSFLTGGFTIGSHPPSFCVSKNSDVAYYTLALPMSIIGATGVSLIFVVLLTVIKHNFNKKTSKSKIYFGTAEKKLLVLFCYFTLLGSVAFVAFALNAKSLNSIGLSFTCFKLYSESGTLDTSVNCDTQVKANVSQIFYLLAIVLVAILPAASLIFVLQCAELKRCCKSCNKRQPLKPCTAVNKAWDPDIIY